MENVSSLESFGADTPHQMLSLAPRRNAVQSRRLNPKGAWPCDLPELGAADESTPPPCPGGNTGSRKKAPARSLARLLITCASPPLPAPLASRAHWPATLQGKVSLKIHRYIPLHANQLQKTTRALNIF